MELSTTPTDPCYEGIIFPPGNTLLAANGNPMEVPIQKTGGFTFKNQYKKPLPSLLEVEYNEDNDSIKVCILFFVNSSFPLEEHHLVVNQLFTISNYGHYKLQFFLHTNSEGVCKAIKGESTDGEYIAYTTEFTTTSTVGFPDNIELRCIKVAQSFIWDIDPETSRGTETVVKGSNGG
ncbi:hypothetical protein [Tenacibaculum amylolyticum]|uniref:hypothetical protein n=1 Tax=Tenacibaculum amylolyticum TaxID=104269 RepID=UPI003895D430